MLFLFQIVFFKCCPMKICYSHLHSTTTKKPVHKPVKHPVHKPTLIPTCYIMQINGSNFAECFATSWSLSSTTVDTCKLQVQGIMISLQYLLLEDCLVLVLQHSNSWQYILQYLPHSDKPRIVWQCIYKFWYYPNLNKYLSNMWTHKNSSHIL